MLLRHPTLRLYVMHAGWPLLDEMIQLLWAHPQLYVDLAWINYVVPRPEFHAYLKRLMDAGFGKRIMYGSDTEPSQLGAGIASIDAAPFLTLAQKRDIFYNNAARFLKRQPTPLSR